MESPSLMYFFPLDQIGSSLLQLESLLCDFYNIDSNCIPFTPDEVVASQACCVKEVEKGELCVYRGMFVSGVGADSTCRVLCVDYGWTLVVPLVFVFKLDNQFYSFPVMVSAGSLFGIYPFSDASTPSSDQPNTDRNTLKWSRDVSDKLSSLVVDKLFVGVLYETSSVNINLFPTCYYLHIFQVLIAVTCSLYTVYYCMIPAMEMKTPLLTFL